MFFFIQTMYNSRQGIAIFHNPISFNLFIFKEVRVNRTEVC